MFRVRARACDSMVVMGVGGFCSHDCADALRTDTSKKGANFPFTMRAEYLINGAGVYS